MHWGLFWRSITFSEYQTGDIIEAAAHIHNFIVDEWDPPDTTNGQDLDNDNFQSFS